MHDERAAVRRSPRMAAQSSISFVSMQLRTSFSKARRFSGAAGANFKFSSTMRLVTLSRKYRSWVIISRAPLNFFR